MCLLNFLLIMPTSENMLALRPPQNDLSFDGVLTLAPGLSAPHRLRDLADVQDLILALALPVVLEDKLDQSVRAEYRRLWEIAQKAREHSEQSESAE